MEDELPGPSKNYIEQDDSPKSVAPAASAVQNKEKLKGKLKTYLMFPWDKAVIRFVCTIWSIEVWQKCIESLSELQMEQKLTRSDRYSMMAFLLIAVAVIFLGMCGTGFTLYILLERKVNVIKVYKLTIKVPKIPKSTKYYILIIGLGVHLGWSAVSALTVLCHKVFAGMYMLWMGIAWYIVHPIRYLLIFHQKIPIPFLHSHMLVTCNEGLILLARYFFTVFLAGAKTMSESGFIAAWVVLLVLGIVWILGIYFVKRYQNPLSEELDDVRRLYETTEAVSSFNEKQTPTRQLIFTAVIAPGVILALMRGAVSALLRSMALEAGNPVVVGFHDYRADLIVAVVTMITIESIVIFVRKYRTDVFELVVIGIAHVLYIIVLVLIAVLIANVQHVLKETPRRGYALVEIYLSDGNSNTAGYILGDTEIKFGSPFGATFLKDQIPMESTEEKMLLRIFFGSNFLRANITLESEKFQLFHMVQTGDFVKITKPNKVLPSKYTFDPLVYVLNSIKECDEYDHDLATVLGINLTNAKGVMFTGGVCAPVEISFHVMRSFAEEVEYANIDHDLVKEVIRVKPPGFEGITPYVTIPCQYRPHPNNSNTCVTVFQGYYKMFEYYNGIGKPFPSPERQAFRLVSLKPYSINPRRLDYLTKPYELINALETIKFRNVEAFGLEKMLPPMLLHGIATGIGLVSYTHLMWRQAPIPHRVLIFYGYFASTYLLGWIANIMDALRSLHTVTAVSVLLVIQASAAAWHIFFAVKLYQKMSNSTERYTAPEKPSDIKE